MSICTVEGCDRDGSLTRGMCGKHYQRWRFDTPRDQRPTAPRFRDFESRCERGESEADCWLWTAAINPNGYGTFSAAPNGLKAAHRFAYAEYVGPIPLGAQIDHICHVRRCVNPSHLRAVTASQNQQNRSGARAGSASGIRGVWWDAQRRKWRVSAKADGHRYYGGFFTDIEAARAAAVRLRNRVHTHNDADRKVG